MVGDRHDAWDDGNIDSSLFAIIKKSEVGLWVKEVLGDSAISAGFDFALEVLKIRPKIRGLRMHLRVGSHFNVEVILGFFTNKGDQFIRIAKFTG